MTNVLWGVGCASSDIDGYRCLAETESDIDFLITWGQNNQIVVISLISGINGKSYVTMPTFLSTD